MSSSDHPSPSDHSKHKGSPPLSLQAAFASLKGLAKTDNTALEKIEEIADNIDFICDASEKDNEEINQEISNNGTITILLQMFASPCQEVMKLALSGLERLLTSEELAIVAIEAGAFEIFSTVFLDSTEPLYLRLKASSILVLMLISDYERNMKALTLQNGLFTSHLAMITPTSTSDTCEAILRFLFAVTDDCTEAQEQLASSVSAIGFLLDLVKQRQFQALGPLCNLLPLDGLKTKLPVAEIELLLTPLLNDSETEIDDVNYDRVVLLVSNLIDSEREDPDTHALLLEQLQDMAFAILDGSLLTCSLLQVLSGINNLAVSDHNKLNIGNSEIPKLLMDILQRQGALVFTAPDDDEGPNGNTSGGSGADGGGDGEEEDQESKDIKALAAKVIWSLAFHESNRRKMETGGTLQTIQKLATQGDNKQVKRNLEGCLWIFNHANFDAQANPNNPNNTNNPNNPNNTPNTTSLNTVPHTSNNTGNVANTTSTTTNTTQTTITSDTNQNVPIVGSDESSSSSQPKQKLLESWTVEDVKHWLVYVGLGQYAPKFGAQRIDGRALTEIAHNICDIQFLEMVEKRLEFHLFGDLMGFVHAVRKHI